MARSSFSTSEKQSQLFAVTVTVFLGISQSLWCDFMISREYGCLCAAGMRPVEMQAGKVAAVPCRSLNAAVTHPVESPG